MNSSSAIAPSLKLGISNFSFSDLFEPTRLADLHAVFDEFFKASAPEAYAQFDAYRRSRGKGMSPEQVSEALLAAAPHVGAFLGKLFCVEEELAALRQGVIDRDPLWRFKREFARKRVLAPGAGKRWLESGRDAADAARVAAAVLEALRPRGLENDEELGIAETVLLLTEVDEVARKAAKSGGAQWTDELRDRAQSVRQVLVEDASAREIARNVCAETFAGMATDAENAQVIAFVLDAFETWLAHRRNDRSDPAHAWPSLRAPKSQDYSNLVTLRRPDPNFHEVVVGPEHERRERGSFELTDRRMSARDVEQEIDYCLFCHTREKDSCSKGMHEKGKASAPLKTNPLGIPLAGCPLEEKISETHVLRRDGDVLGALAMICIDNPMCPGTGHRICNDCMKACIFQKQDPVNIPQVETRVLSEVLGLPWGLEIYGLLTRFNPLNIERPYGKPYNGKNVLVVGLGPAGYTLSHHLASEGFGVVAVDGLKIEPLAEDLIGSWERPPTPVRDVRTLATELDERILLGFGGVSEYGITVRWDKNFLTVLYITLARNRLLRVYGGVRFGGTLTLDDAWDLGFDHVAIAAGAGKPTIIDVKNNLARGIRQASDFLMALQLTGAYKKSSIANLQVKLPAIVIGGGLTAIDTATELLAYYVVQVEKTRERFETLARSLGDSEVRGLFDDEEWATLEEQLRHARELAEERGRALLEGRPPRIQDLLARWGGVSLVYRKSLVESPAYRLNHEEVAKSLEEGIRYIENLTPIEAVLDGHGHVTAMQFRRKDGSMTELPARTICVAAGTSPNIIYEKEHPGTFQLDKRGQFFQSYEARRLDGERLVLVPAENGRVGFFTSYRKGDRTVSFYGDNHPAYAGSVVKAMASAKDGYPHVAALFPEARVHDPTKEPEHRAKLKKFFERLDGELIARVVDVNRLTDTIVEVVVRAPMAARKFKPGQFYRLQNFETLATTIRGTRLVMEGVALTGAWTDPEKGLLGTIVLEMGTSTRLCAALKPDEPVILMGPTGAPTEIAKGETVLLCGGGLGNAVLFSIARAFQALGSKVIYFAGYKRGEDLFKQDEIERCTDQVIWSTDKGRAIEPRRPQDAHFRGNIVEAMVAYGQGELGSARTPLSEVNRIIAIGSDRMMAAVQVARHGVLAPLLDPKHTAIGSINSPMQCMMKEVCAQCLQKHRDPVTGKESVVFSCSNQDQELDRVDFSHLNQRLRANSMQEKLANAWLDHLLAGRTDILRV